MMEKHAHIFTEYYRMTAGRSYSEESRNKILQLVAAAHGVFASDKDYENIVNTIKEIEYWEINTVIDCCNFRTLYNRPVGDDDFLPVAVTALEKVLSSITVNGKPVSRRETTDILLELSTARTLSPEAKFEYAILEFSLGHKDAAVSALAELANPKSPSSGTEAPDYNLQFTAMTYLAVLGDIMREPELALYYISLVSAVYRQRLRISTPEWVQNLSRRATDAMSAEKADEISHTVQKTTHTGGIFVNGERNAIGFVS